MGSKGTPRTCACGPGGEARGTTWALPGPFLDSPGFGIKLELVEPEPWILTQPRAHWAL